MAKKSKTQSRKNRMAEARAVIAEKRFDLLDECLKFAPGADRRRFIEGLKSERGGWDALTLARLGVSWPPRHGWRYGIEQGGGPEWRPFAEPRLSKLMGERL